MQMINKNKQIIPIKNTHVITRKGVNLITSRFLAKIDVSLTPLVMQVSMCISI